MRIRNWKNETAETLLNRVIRQGKKGFCVSSISTTETKLHLEQINSELVEVIENYLNRKVFGQIAEDNGICRGVTPERRALLNRFSIETSQDKRLIFQPFVLQHNSYLYNAIEATFDIGLLTERGAARVFRQDYELQRTIQYVSYREYIAHYNGWLLHINTDTGRIFKYDRRFVEGIEEVKVDVVKGRVIIRTKKDKEFTVYNKNRHLGKWTLCESTKKDGNKVYMRIQLSQSSDDKYGSGYYILQHHLIAMCEWGYDLIKHCRGEFGLLTVDHKNKDTFNNGIDNLGVLTRSDNKKTAVIGGYVYFNWVAYWERVENDRIVYRENKSTFDNMYEVCGF